MTPTEMLLSCNGEDIAITLAPSLTFSTLLQQAHALFHVNASSSSPYHLSTASGVSLDDAGSVNVVAYLKNYKEPRIFFGPKPRPIKRTLNEVLQSVHPESRGSESDSDDEVDKENQPVRPSAAKATKSPCPPLPSSPAPIQSQLWRIYTHYCMMAIKPTPSASSSSACPFDSLSSSHWIKFLEDCIIIAPAPPTPSSSSPSAAFSRHQADLLHLTLCKKNNGKFSFDQFLVALTKVASTAFRFSAEPGELLRFLLLRHVLPLAGRSSGMEGAELLKDGKVSVLLGMFAGYHSAAHIAYGGAGGWLTFAGYQQWATDCKLTKLIPQVELARCFLAAVEEGDSAQWWAGPGKLRLDQFTFSQCVARLLTHGLPTRHPLNLYTMKALYQQCHANPPPRMLKAQPADRKNLDRMLKALDAAFQTMWKADGKRDYLAASAQVRTNLLLDTKLTAYESVQWERLLDEDRVWATVERGLILEVEKAQEAVEGKKQRLSAGSLRRPAAVKTGTASKGSGRKAAQAGPNKTHTAKEAEGLSAGTPRTPRVVALVPRTPAGKKVNTSREEEVAASDSEEEEEEEDANSALLQAKRAEDERLLALLVDAEKRRQREEADAQQRAGQQHQQAEQREKEKAEREQQWQREKDAELAKIREQERLERERKEEHMQREIALLKEQLALQQQLQQQALVLQQQQLQAHLAASAAPVVPAAPSSAPVAQKLPLHEEPEEGQVSGSDEEDEANVTVIQRTSLQAQSSTHATAASPAPPTLSARAQPPAQAAVASVHMVSRPATIQPSSSSSAVVSAKAPARPATVAPVQVERAAASITVQPAKQPVQEEKEQPRSPRAAASPSVFPAASHESANDRRLHFNASVSRVDSDDDDDESDDEVDEPLPAPPAPHPAQLSDDDEMDSDEEDVGPFTVAIDCSYSVNQSLASTHQQPPQPVTQEAESEDSDCDDLADANLLQALERSMTHHSTQQHMLLSHSRDQEEDDSDDGAGEQEDAQDDERTVQIHQPTQDALNRDFSETRWLADSTTRLREDEAKEAEDNVLVPAEFDEAAHAERVRLLQIELKARLDARRRMQRRASYVEEEEEKRMMAEMRAKQAALAQLRMLKAKQERERERAELDLASQHAAAAQAAAAAERAKLDAELTRKARAEHRQAAELTADVLLFTKQRTAQWASLVRAVERGDTMTRYYDSWWVKPKPKFLRVSMLGSPKLWWGSDMFHQDKHIDLTDVIAVKSGAQSSVANRLPLEGLTCAFSVLTDEKAIHLVAASHATREVWMSFFDKFLAQRAALYKDDAKTRKSTGTVQPTKPGMVARFSAGMSAGMS